MGENDVHVGKHRRTFVKSINLIASRQFNIEVFQAVALAQSVVMASLVSSLHHKPRFSMFEGVAQVVATRVLTVRRERKRRDRIVKLGLNVP